MCMYVCTSVYTYLYTHVCRVCVRTISWTKGVYPGVSRVSSGPRGGSLREGGWCTGALPVHTSHECRVYTSTTGTEAPADTVSANEVEVPKRLVVGCDTIRLATGGCYKVGSEVVTTCTVRCTFCVKSEVCFTSRADSTGLSPLTRPRLHGDPGTCTLSFVRP